MQREEASGMGAGKLGAETLVWNPSTTYLSPVKAVAFLSSRFAAALSPCVLLPGGLPPPSPAELCFLGQGHLPQDVTLHLPPERPLAVQDRKLCELLPSMGGPWGGQDGVSLEWQRLGCPLSCNWGVTGVPSTIALPWVTMGSLESLKFLLKQRIVTLWLLCSAASWWYSVIKSILWFWLSEGSNSEEKLFLGGCVFVCLLFWLPFGCFWPSLCCVFFNKNLLPWLVVEQI